MKKILAIFLIAVLGFSLPSCSWLGRTVGKAKAKMERKADDVGRSYHQGYADEKGKTEKAVPAHENVQSPVERQDENKI
ncbi:MAG: hypothetical protein LBB66_06755 [Desulfovibrio sp.]|jgi:hypothetical protein|nr:hypothetical protein [Desulfovibrio sp.]